MLLEPIAVTFFVTLMFMVALRPLAHDIGLVDVPGGRKKHTDEVPLVGGIAMFLGLAVGLLLLPAIFPSLVHLALACGLLVGIGVLDDRYGVPTSIRLATHLVAVLIMVFGAGLTVTNIGSPFGFGVIYLGPASLIVTVLITASVINAFNFADGADGLAGTFALIALGSIALVGGYQSPAAVTALLAASAVLAFLQFNFPSIHNRKVLTFMGDAGSTFVGLVIVWVTTGVSQGSDAIASPVVCLWFVALPIFDFFTCIVRRGLNGHSPFRPDRDHFHHILLRGGMGDRSVLAVLAALQGIYAIIGLTGHFYGATDVFMFAGWAIIGLSQRWIISLIASIYRLNFRSRPVREY